MTTRFSSHEVQSLAKEQVLQLPADDRLAYFEAIRLRHPRLARL